MRGVVDYKTAAHCIHRTDQNHDFSSRLQAFLARGDVHYSLIQWVTVVFHTIFRLRMHLQASLDSACITLTSLSIKLVYIYIYIYMYIYYQNCYLIRTPSFILSLRRSLSLRVIASTPRLSVPFGASSGTCALCGALATDLVTPAIFAGDPSPSVGLSVLTSRIQDSQYNTGSLSSL